MAVSLTTGFSECNHDVTPATGVKWPGMSQQREHAWLIVAVLGVVFLSALSMHMERIVGWSFLVLCFIVGSLGALAWIFVRNQTL